MKRTLRIGTRGSKLALAQAEWFRGAIEERCAEIEASLVIIKTSGDRFVDRPLADIGGKGLFVKEIEQALLDGTIDCAIHSMKDVPSELAGDLIIAAIPPREDPRDVLVSRNGSALEDLPPGATIGTSSTRRRALCRALRPDLEVAELRGNVDTRLGKLESAAFDAIILAAAGLRRLGLTPAGIHHLDCQTFVPAIGQGALAIESRPDEIADILRCLDDPATRACVAAERAVLKALGGSCHTPIAAHARLDGDRLQLDGIVVSPDGRSAVRTRTEGPVAAAAALGDRLAESLQSLGADAILANLEGR